MTDPKLDSDSTPKKKSDKKVFILAAIAFVAILVVSLMSDIAPRQPANEASTEEAQVSEEAVDAAAEPAVTPADAPAGFDLQKATQERILGNPAAPIKVMEFSSFTCGHCGHFHKETFDEFKTNYIDTGKAYLVFSDFPLNAPALHASKIARCVADDRYFGFVHTLYLEQEKWAYEAGYLTFLKDKAAEYGVGEELFNYCLKSKELEDHIINRIKAVQQQWNIKSTPSFVINNQKVLYGAMPYDDFDEAIKSAVVELGVDVTPVSAMPETPAPADLMPAELTPVEVVPAEGSDDFLSQSAHPDDLSAPLTDQAPHNAPEAQ
ncbi:MAG: thioredoxin domain-containing protein [Alphaproteobacteria bacterium]|nr:thioredoxin domain-containing protein [Alphaproteobacteria bacterium]